jgi:hypothetical protein
MDFSKSSDALRPVEGGERREVSGKEEEGVI